MTSRDHFERLQRLYSSLGGDTSFTERQTAGRSDLPD
jgi:hypothetical protein